MNAAARKPKPKLYSIRIENPEGHTLHVFDRESRDTIVKEANRALAAGHVVRWEDGTREWHVLRERVDTTKSGSDQYEWNVAGSKVRADLVRHTQRPGPDGKPGKIETSVMSRRPRFVVLA